MDIKRISDARREYARRNAIRFTQKDAAAYFGVSLGTYRNWEQGRVELSSAQLGQLSDLYGVTVDYLLGKTANYTASSVRIGMSEQEHELVDIYRSLNAHGRDQLMVFARGCAASYPLNQADAMGA